MQDATNGASPADAPTLRNANHRITLKARPTGIPGPENFNEDVVPIRAPEAGELLVETLYLSIDPAMRSWIGDSPGYTRRIEIGDPMRAGGIARGRGGGRPTCLPPRWLGPSG